MGTLRRGLSLGAAFGLAAAVLDLTLRFLLVTQQRIAPGAGTLARAALVHVALGALLGLAGSPLLLARRAPRASFLAHLAWLAAAWLALETWLAVDSPLLSRGMYA